MDSEPLQSRLSRIATQWTLLEHAHKGDMHQRQDALAKMMEHYHRAAYRYLLAILRDADRADEVFQEFAVRFFRGDFRHATADRGRFRNYLKTAICRLVVDYHRREQRHRGAVDSEALAADPLASDDATGMFEESWQAELLARAWKALAEEETASGRPYYTVLKCRSENPAASSPEMAAIVNSQLQPAQPINDAYFRQILHRARECFADRLLDEVAASLATDDLDEVEQELVSVDLLSYCRFALQQRREQRGTQVD